MAVVSARGVHKHYGRTHALRGIDLDIAEGEIFGFLGTNGAGKTTFTRCITGFIRPTRGTIQVAGHDVTRHPHRALRHVGIVPDEYELYGALTARGNMLYAARLYGLRGAAAERRVNAVLDLVGMSDKAGKKAKAFSHGMKQRTAIGMALLHKPRLLILDEPSNGLDPKGAYELRRIMQAIATQGTSVFLNSHIMSEVDAVCDRIAIVKDGAIVRLDAAKNLRREARRSSTTISVLEANTAALEAARAVAPVRVVDQNQLEVQGDQRVVGQVVAALATHGCLVHEVKSAGNDLEEVFLHLTGSDGPPARRNGHAPTPAAAGREVAA